MTEHTISAERGEVAVTLEGVVYPARPNGPAQMAIEEQLGTTLIELYYRMDVLYKRSKGQPAEGNAGLTLKQMAVVLTECIKAAGRDRGDTTMQAFTVDRVAEIIAFDRMRYSEPLLEIIAATLQKDDGEKKA